MTVSSILDAYPPPNTFAELEALINRLSRPFRPIPGHPEIDRDALLFEGVRRLCERRANLFARILNLCDIKLLDYWALLRIANYGVAHGVINDSSAVDIMGSSAHFYGHQAATGIPVHIPVRANFIVPRLQIKLADRYAYPLEQILRYDGTPEETGIVMPVVAGDRLYRAGLGVSDVEYWKVTYIRI